MLSAKVRGFGDVLTNVWHHNCITMRMKKISNLLLFLLLIVSYSCNGDESSINGTDDTTNPDSELAALTLIDESYGSHAMQNYDIYLPAGRTAAATNTIILVHGGGWTSGSKEDMNGIVDLIRDVLPDYAIVNMNYRLASIPSVPAFPNQTDDLAAMINQLNDQQETLQINGKYALLGISAGGHLSTLYSYTQNTNNAVKAVVNMVAPVDFTDPYYASNSNFQLLLNALVDENAFPPGTALDEAVSPVLQITSSSPPTISFYGNQDPLVAVSQLNRLETALNDAGVANESTIYDGGHANWSVSQYEDLQSKVAAFLTIHMP